MKNKLFFLENIYKKIDLVFFLGIIDKKTAVKGTDMKLGKTTQFVIYNILASFGISLSISFFMTLMLKGLSNDFFSLWFESFLMGYIIAVPSSMVVIPIVNRIMNRITSET